MDAGLLNFRFFKPLAVVAALALCGVVVSHAASWRVAPADAEERIHGSVLPAPDTIEVTGPQTVLMEITAYCPCRKCCGPKAQGITASGKRVNYNGGRFVAADTRLLPFGTRISIPGYHDAEPVEVIDRGGAIKGNKLDVFFPDHQTAREWGRRQVVVSVLP